MPSTLDTLKAAVVASITSDMPTWSQSATHYDLFARDADDAIAKRYAIGFPTTVPAATQTRRGAKVTTSAGGVWCRSEMRVRWAYRLRFDNPTGDHETALGAEVAMLDAIAGADLDGLGSLTFERITRSALGEGTFLVCDAVFDLRHLYDAIG